MNKAKNPIPTVDIIIELKIPLCPSFSKGLGSRCREALQREAGDLGIVLIERRNPPFGWAIPGGFVDYGETLEHAAKREALEETSLKVRLKRQLHSYSDPKRDNRFHTISTVFVAEADGIPHARDDAKEIGIFKEDNLPQPLAFDHKRILEDYFKWKREGFTIYELRITI